MNIRNVIKILVLLVTINSCSNDDNYKPNCFHAEKRHIEAKFTDYIGEIDNEGCQSNYTIVIVPAPPNIYLPLAPCNLSDEFKKDGLKVKFSGYKYEVFETEDLCALPFEITKMELE